MYHLYERIIVVLGTLVVFVDSTLEHAGVKPISLATASPDSNLNNKLQ
jgi:hypothetical protein